MPDLPEADQPAHRLDHIVRGLSARLVHNEHPIEGRRKRLSGHNLLMGYFPPVKQLPAFEISNRFFLGQDPFQLGTAQECTALFTA